MKTKVIICLMVCMSLLFCGICACGHPAETTTDPDEPVAEDLSDGVVDVTTVQELMDAFSDLKSGDVIRLNADIDMDGQQLAVVNSRGFTLDGNGHTISNYCVKGKSGLFVDNASNCSYTIKNLTLNNCALESDDEFAALFIGAARDTDTVTISNCNAIDCTVTGEKYAAVFVSYTAGTDKGTGETVTMTVEDCSAIGCTVTGGGSTGIAIGHSGGNDLTRNLIINLTVTDCTVSGEDAIHEGVVIGTAGTGVTEISGIIAENVTTVHNFGQDFRRYFGRNLTQLFIDGVLQEKTNS